MYEIRDLDVPDHLYATVPTIPDAETFLEDRTATTIRQLDANGEGATEPIRLAAAVHRDDGVIVLTRVDLIPHPAADRGGGAGPAGRP